MTERMSIRDAFEDALFYVDPNGARVFRWADPRIVIGEDSFIESMIPAILVSPVIRRIQAEAIREASEAYWDDVNLTRYGEVRDWLEIRARSIERGDR